MATVATVATGTMGESSHFSTPLDLGHESILPRIPGLVNIAIMLLNMAQSK
jgi:hypothetical protein